MSMKGYFKSCLDIYKSTEKISATMKKDFKTLCSQLEVAIGWNEIDVNDPEVKRLIEEYRAIRRNLA